MTDHEVHCTHAARLPGLPTKAELVELRKQGWRKRRKAKHPPVRVAAGSHPQLGEFQITRRGRGYSIRFRYGSSGRARTVLLSALCDRSDLAGERLKFGWLVGHMHALDAIHLRSAIPGPHEAMRESAPLFKAAEEWHLWAIG